MSGRHQKTLWLDGVRVMLTWRNEGKYRLKVTDPEGDYAKEQHVLEVAVGILAAAFIHEKVGVNIGAPSLVLDHPETTP